MVNYQEYDSMQTPYKKKSKRKPPTKSDHRHDFQPCIFEVMDNTYTSREGCTKVPSLRVGSYCSICGKIGKIDLFGVDPDERGTAKTLYRYSAEKRTQLNRTTRTWPTFKVDDPFRQRYVWGKGDSTTNA